MWKLFRGEDNLFSQVDGREEEAAWKSVRQHADLSSFTDLEKEESFQKCKGEKFCFFNDRKSKHAICELLASATTILQGFWESSGGV